MVNIASKIPKSTPSEVDVKNACVSHQRYDNRLAHARILFTYINTKRWIGNVYGFETARLLNGPTNAYTIFRVLLGFSSLYR